MNSPAEERLQRMLEEGKITPQQFEELRTALAAAEAGRTARGAKPTDADADWDRIFRACLEKNRAPFIESSFALRKRLLAYGIAASAIGVPIGLAMNLPFVWGLGLAGLIIGSYKYKRLMKMKDSR